MRIFRQVPLFSLVSLALAMPLATFPTQGQAQITVGVSITVPPPPLPVYAQPVIPEEGYIWLPGYWAWGPYGYYWVPGTWAMPPTLGLLWTPGYWAWREGIYIWNAGYWAPRVGFYGGINYGYGYIGTGYVGGFWERDRFHYNRVVNNFGSVHITNVYNRTVVNNINVTRVSFNGGRGGIGARPSAAQQSFAREAHIPPTDLQRRHEETAGNNRALLSSVNHGRPPIAATPRPAAFEERGTVKARGANSAPQTGATNSASPAPRAPDANRPAPQTSAPANPAPAAAPRPPSNNDAERAARHPTPQAGAVPPTRSPEANRPTRQTSAPANVAPAQPQAPRPPSNRDAERAARHPTPKAGVAPQNGPPNAAAEADRAAPSSRDDNRRDRQPDNAGDQRGREPRGDGRGPDRR